MSQIFISYASDDEAKAKPLAERLEQEGWTVWWDRYIPPGKTFDEVIEENLDQSICVIVLWSAHSVRSDWVKTEAGEGKARRILVPALIGKVSIPLAFRRIQAADLIGWPEDYDKGEFNQFLKAIRRVISENEEAEIAAAPTSKKKKPSSKTLGAPPDKSQKNYHKDIDKFLAETHKSWLSGSLAVISKSFYEAANSQELIDFSNDLKESFGKGIIAVLRIAFFGEKEFLVGAGGESDNCSFVMTNEMLYLFTKNKTEGPITIIRIKDIISYELKRFLNLTVHAELRTGQKLKIKGMNFAPKEEYIHLLSR